MDMCVFKCPARFGIEELRAILDAKLFLSCACTRLRVRLNWRTIKSYVPHRSFVVVEVVFLLGSVHLAFARMAQQTIRVAFM